MRARWTRRRTAASSSRPSRPHLRALRHTAACRLRAHSAAYGARCAVGARATRSHFESRRTHRQAVRPRSAIESRRARRTISCAGAGVACGRRASLAAGIAHRTVLPYGALWANVPWPEHATLLPNAPEQRYSRASRMAGVLPIGQRALGEPRLAAFFWSLKRNQVATWRSSGIAAPLSRLPIADTILARLVSGMTTAPLARNRFVPLRMSSADENR